MTAQYACLQRNFKVQWEDTNKMAHRTSKQARAGGAHCSLPRKRARLVMMEAADRFSKWLSKHHSHDWQAVGKCTQQICERSVKIEKG